MVKTIVIACALLAAGIAQGQVPADLRTRMDKAAAEVLAASGVPSASVAVVKNGTVAYVQAYGKARLGPATLAKPAMRYSIGSISKEFTAAAILLLQQDGKLSLDDPVSEYFPDLTRAGDVTIRQLLSHTSGYQDYWPQDYVMPMMLEPVTAQKIMDTWGKKPLDFNPGTRWQYSNTNYVIAGGIVEKVAGRPVFDFIRERIFVPLEMASVANIDEKKLGDTDAAGYMRYALGPLRLAPKEGAGWLFAAGELAMTAEDLAKWDAAIIGGKLLSPVSFGQLENEVKLADGAGTQYGLGVFVRLESGRRTISHGGEVSGFTSSNVIYPDDGIAVAVLTNQDAASASGAIAQKFAQLLLEDAATARKQAQAKQIFAGLQRGTIDRSLFTANANSYFTARALKDFAASLGPLGAPKDFTQTSQGLRGGMLERSYRVSFARKALHAWTYEMPDGKLEQFQVAEEP